MVNFETIKIKQEEDQINYYFSKLTYIIIVYFIIIFDAFFIYFLSFIIALSFNEPFATALISACCSVSALFFATYFTQFYQQWKNKINDFQKQHQAFYQQVIIFNRFLLFSDLDKISFNKDRLFIDYHFFPNYIFQWMSSANCKNSKVILINELILWRKYLNNLEHLNTLSWIKCLRILIEYKFNLSKTVKKQILTDINTIEKEIFIFFKNQTNSSISKNLIIKQNYHHLWIQFCQKRSNLKQIKNALKMLSFNLKTKSLSSNPLVEEKLSLNIFQLSYLKFLFTITFF